VSPSNRLNALDCMLVSWTEGIEFIELNVKPVGQQVFGCIGLLDSLVEANRHGVRSNAQSHIPANCTCHVLATIQTTRNSIDNEPACHFKG
jgi:hypothetical protein